MFAAEKSNKEVKVLPNPAAFFDILRESDDRARCEKLSHISLQIEDEEDGTQSELNPRHRRLFNRIKKLLGLCSTTLPNLDQSWQSHIPELLQQLAGSIYIDTKCLRRLGPLGEGGFAVVERMELFSQDRGTRQIVAVKKLKPGVIEDDNDLKELVEEANLLLRVKHKGIVDFKGIGCFDESSIKSMRESIFLAEEYMPGGTLKNVILSQMRVARRRYKMEDAWRWLMEMAEALNYLHSCNPSVVHRDVKPENVLMSSDRLDQAHAKIADFGLHKRINKVAKMKKTKSTQLIQSLETTTAVNTYSRSAEIDIPIAKGKTERLHQFRPELPSHFRIIKRSTSLSAGREFSLSVVPEDSPVTESSLGRVSSAYSLPPAVIMGDFTSIASVEPSSSIEFSKSLREAVEEIDGEQTRDEDRVTSAASVCSEHSSEERVRGGNLGEILGLDHKDSTTKSTKLATPFANLEDSAQQLKHFLFEPANEDVSTPDKEEEKRRGSSKALETLLSLDNTQSKPSLRDIKRSVRFSNRYALGLSGTTLVSGIVGSLMYMAPEVFKGKHYDEKVDVFGFGVVMYELLKSELVIVKVLMQARRPREMAKMLKKHAKWIAKGNREEIPDHWPLEVKQLVEDCWNQNPKERPKMSEVIERLSMIQQQGLIKQMDLHEEQMAQSHRNCGFCCIL